MGPLPDNRYAPILIRNIKLKYQERYQPILVGVDATVNINSDSVGGFLCKTAGTITISEVNEITGALVTIVDAHPVSAGIYYPLPFHLGSNGGRFVAAGGASGTLGV